MVFVAIWYMLAWFGGMIWWISCLVGHGRYMELDGYMYGVSRYWSCHTYIRLHTLCGEFVWREIRVENKRVICGGKEKE